MNKLFYSIVALLFIILSWFIFDLNRYLPPDLIFSQGIKYESTEVQKQIAITLKEKNIPFRINNEGFIEFRKKDDERVKKIAAQIHIALSPEPKDEQPPPNTSFSNPETHKLFVTLLQKEGIPYKIDSLDDKGNKYVIWDLSDDEKVLKIISQVEQKTSCNNNPPSISFPTKRHTDYFINLLKEGGISYKVIEKTNQQGSEIYIEYNWDDYVKVKKLIRKTIAEAEANSKT
jgi:hypothetical protein